MRRRAIPILILLAVLVAGCGGSKSSAPTTSPPAATTSPPPPTATPTRTTKPPAIKAGGPGALQGEAATAATGDVPDNQVFIVFRNPTAGYSMRYPEGWAQQESGGTVTFRDKNNIVRIVIGHGSAPTAASVRKDLATQSGVKITSPPHRVTISGAPAIKVVYTAQSPPNPVTGKRVVLMVDRYYLSHRGRTAVVDLGTPQSVDNVDAYRLMIQSFRWR